MKKKMRVRLGALFYQLAVMPGLDPQAMGIAAEMVRSLLKSVQLLYHRLDGEADLHAVPTLDTDHEN